MSFDPRYDLPDDVMLEFLDVERGSARMYSRHLPDLPAPRPRDQSDDDELAEHDPRRAAAWNLYQQFLHAPLDDPALRSAALAWWLLRENERLADIALARDAALRLVRPGVDLVAYLSTLAGLYMNQLVWTSRHATPKSAPTVRKRRRRVVNPK